MLTLRMNLSIPSTGRQAMKLQIYDNNNVLIYLSIPSTGRQAMKLSISGLPGASGGLFQYPQRVVRQ